jgi:3-methylcrotonyl-CoA carboxylase alpha subunit
VPSADVLHAAALSVVLGEVHEQQARTAQSTDPYSPWALGDGWRINAASRRELRFLQGDAESAVKVDYHADGWSFDGQAVRLLSSDMRRLQFRIGDRTVEAYVVADGEHLHVFTAGGRTVLTRIDPLAHAGEEADAHGGLLAPMPGKILALLAEAGAEVEKGAPLLVMEAMKMEHTLCAPANGKVRDYLCKPGELVQGGAELVDFEANA